MRISCALSTQDQTGLPQSLFSGATDFPPEGDRMTNLVAAPGRLPAGESIYAIGDIHGCADRLAALHAAIAAHAAAAAPAKITLVHLGDYVDRGPDSAPVVARIAGPPPVPGAAVVNLRGNHEAMMLDALTGDRGAVGLWLANAGERTLQSWGVSPTTPPSGWAAAIPAADRAVLAGLKLTHRAGGYLFVHAGIRPSVPIERQDPHDLLWIREPFLSWDRPLDAVVVHGHTPTPQPVIRANRIGIDTGAVMGGVLTCVVLEEDRLGFMTG
jgi:serine/threonine protein phosphatase 1